MWIIYKYTNNLNGKGYIGQTKNLPVRQAEHQRSTSKCTAFKSAINKYGFDSFSFSILESNIPTLDETNKREQHFIKEHNTFGTSGYNLTRGGDAGAGRIGEQCSYAKLTETQVKDILQSPTPALYMIGKYQVDKATVYQIRTGKSWRHLSYLALKSYTKATGKTEHSLKSRPKKINDIIAQNIIDDDRPHTELARLYNITPSAIIAIRTGRTRKYLDRSTPPKYQRYNQWKANQP